jgi:hypothetical protein
MALLRIEVSEERIASIIRVKSDTSLRDVGSYKSYGT